MAARIWIMKMCVFGCSHPGSPVPTRHAEAVSTGRLRSAGHGFAAVLGIPCDREVFFKPNRIIYRIQATSVYVYLIADGRREMQTLLSRRLLDA